MCETTRTLTPELVRDYIADHGALCPFCRSQDIEAARFDGEADHVRSPVSCTACRREWRDVFLLTAVDLIGEDGSITTILPTPAPSKAEIVMTKLCAILYQDYDGEKVVMDRDKEWDADTLEAIGRLMEDCDLVPGSGSAFDDPEPGEG